MECHNATKSVNREVSFDSCVNSTALSVWWSKPYTKPANHTTFVTVCVLQVLSLRSATVILSSVYLGSTPVAL